MHQDFQNAKRTWWWIESEPALKRFCADSFAQGYELLRRSDRIAPRLPACHCPPDSTWKQLYQIQKDYFIIGYRTDLHHLGLHKRVCAGPNGITFDATQSDDTLIKALAAEIEHPTPLACGLIDPGKSFRAVAHFQAHKDTEVCYTERPTDIPLWSHSRYERQMVHLPLPRYERYLESRELSDREALAYFRNFIKDNPPPDFAAYRSSFPPASRHKRTLDDHTLALGLMAHDYSRLPGSALVELAAWLSKSLRAKNLFALQGAAIAKALYNGKARVNRLFQELERKRWSAPSILNYW